MPIQIVRNDITQMSCDAIVNATDSQFSGRGGTDYAIHQAAGESLASACALLPPGQVGEAQITPGFALPCRYIIHTVGPTWQDGESGERDALIRCYTNSLELAKKNGCESVAFPLISAGSFGYPKDKAMRIALDAIGDFLMQNDMLVYIVLYNGEAYRLGSMLFSDITSYIDDNYVQRRYEMAMPSAASVDALPKAAKSANRAPKSADKIFGRRAAKISSDSALRPGAMPDELAESCDACLKDGLDAELANYLKRVRDESFSQMLLRCIDERGMKDSDCYKRANIDRKLFSKIRSDVNYRPGKTTVQAFAIALQMDMSEAEELMRKAGYAFSNASMGDVIVRFFIEHGIYDVMMVNEALFSFDQKLLGS